MSQVWKLINMLQIFQKFSLKREKRVSKQLQLQGVFRCYGQVFCEGNHQISSQLIALQYGILVISYHLLFICYSEPVTCSE